MFKKSKQPKLKSQISDSIRDILNVSSLKLRSRLSAAKSAISGTKHSSEMTHGLYFFHVSNDEVEKHFSRLVRETEGMIVWHRLYNPNIRASPITDLDYVHPSLSMPRRYAEMDRKGGILPDGICDVVILPSILASGSEFVWVLEFDVDYSGNWRDFFSQFENNHVDLLTTNLATHRDNPEWTHWKRVRFPNDMHPVKRIRSFTPLMRFSNRFAADYVKALRDEAWSGYYEFTIPTIASVKGYSIEDLGNVGRFSPKHRRGKLYSSTTNDPHLTPGSFVWRPSRNSYFETDPSSFPKKNWLYHPIKPDGTKVNNPQQEARKKQEQEQEQSRAVANIPNRMAVVMATYNGERYLGAQLKTLQEQSRLPDKLIISDDNSSDDTLAIAKEFAKTAKFEVEIYQNEERLGLAQNYIKALGLANEDLILICDQDDMWYRDKIELVVNAAKENPQLAFSHDITVFHRAMTSKRKFIPSYFDHLRKLNLDTSICTKGCGLVVRRSLIDMLGWPDPKAGIAHDLWLSLFTTALNQRAFIEAPLVKHRIHDNKASGWVVSSRDAHKKAIPSNDDAFASMLDFHLPKDSKGWAEALREKLDTVGRSIDAERAENAIKIMEKYI